ncbi:hypothetical protein WJX72_012511 [[Myrmecia] bisecta]|uniref:Uncharacterized protein n=1 Tax=[Myrmecia] bisecta TaxID=41462 RepID=A0AAW1Q8C7_9CHLO
MPARQDSRHGDLQHCAAGSPALSQPTEAAAECQSYEDDTFEAELAGTTADSYQNEAFDDHPELSAAASDDDDLAPAESDATAASELNRCVLVCLLKNRSKELADMLVKAGPPNGRPILAGAAAICTLAKMASSNKPNFGSQREIKQWTADVNGLLHAAGTSGCLDSLEASPLVSTARACLARLDLGTDAAAAMQSGSLEALKRAAGKAAAQQNVPLMRQMKAEIARQGRLGKSVPSQTQAPLPANKAASGRLQARLTPEALAKLRKHDAEQAKVWREWKASKDAQARANRQEDQKRSEHRRAQQHKCLEGAQRRSQAGFASWTNAKHAELLCKTTQRELLNYTRKRDAEKQQFQEVYLADSNTVREQNWRMGSARSGRTDGRAVATARSHHTVPVQLKVSQTA